MEPNFLALFSGKFVVTVLSPYINLATPIAPDITFILATLLMLCCFCCAVAALTFISREWLISQIATILLVTNRL